MDDEFVFVESLAGEQLLSTSEQARPILEAFRDAPRFVDYRAGCRGLSSVPRLS